MILAIDQGTTGTTCLVFDAAGSIRGRAYSEFGQHFPRPGWVEQAPSLWTDALGPAIAEALQAARMRPSDIRAIGFCGQLDGCIAVDNDGNALSPCLIWMDRRAGAEIEDVPAERVYAECGLVLDPGHLGAKARWLRRHLSPRAPIARSSKRWPGPATRSAWRSR